MQGANGEGRVANGFGQTASPGVAPLAARHSPLAHEKARKTSREFEAMFLEQMLERVMPSGDEEGPLGGNGAGGAVYRSMLVKEYAGQMAKSGGVGVADAVFRDLLRLQEGSHA